LRDLTLINSNVLQFPPKEYDINQQGRLKFYETERLAESAEYPSI